MKLDEVREVKSTIVPTRRYVKYKVAQKQILESSRSPQN